MAADLRSDETKAADARVARAIAKERERCAKIVEAAGELQEDDPPMQDFAFDIAAEIRTESTSG